MRAQLSPEVKEEVTNLLSDLIRINTTNPPGNEIQMVKLLARTLEKDGFECELFESAPGRGNLITRIKGENRKPSLLLLSHLDVVAANPKEWSVDPFAGVVKNGCVWGRGAVDMKSFIATEVMVLKLLKRNNLKPKGEIILAATADEEKDGEAGAGWMVKNYPGKVRADYVINEGGGLAIPVEGKNIYTVQTAEKGTVWLKIKAKGKPGHGSRPGLADNAILRMIEVAKRLGTYRSEIRLTPTVKHYLARFAKDGSSAKRQFLSKMLSNHTLADQILDEMAETDKAWAENIRAMLRMTIAPTIIHGGVKENIIPSECEAVFDCRILPGQTTKVALEDIKGLLSDIVMENLEFEVIQANEPSESPIDTPLYWQIVKVLKEFEPNCSVTPTMLTGGTDSRFFRKMGSVSYGFQPMRADLPLGEILKMVHGIDERISIDNLVFGVSVLYKVVEELMT